MKKKLPLPSIVGTNVTKEEAGATQAAGPSGVSSRGSKPITNEHVAFAAPMITWDVFPFHTKVAPDHVAEKVDVVSTAIVAVLTLYILLPPRIAKSAPPAYGACMLQELDHESTDTLD
jgi:hypothetical protein